MSDETTRVNMIWPKELKDRVNDTAGTRGLTEFTLKAVDVHLKGGAEELTRLEDEINQTKHLTQLLADRIVMGGSNVDRLEAFMELELPSWLDTSGWPSEMAKRVPQGADPVAVPLHPVEALGNDGLTDGERADMLESFERGIGAKPKEAPDWMEDVATTPAEKVEKFEELKPKPTVGPSGEELPDNFFEKKVGGSDLFAKVMEKTGGDPLMNELKPASEIPKPDPKPQVDLCPTCGEELVMGECWTCS